EADHQPDFAQPGEPDSQGKGPISFVAYRHSPIRRRRDEWYQVFHRNVWPRQPDRLTCSILEDKAVGFQIPVLLQQADPGFVMVAGHRHRLIGEIPGVEEQDTNRNGTVLLICASKSSMPKSIFVRNCWCNC